MRMPVITRFAKNDRALSGRRRVAVLAATTVLAGGVQFLATDTAWACGSSTGTTFPAPTTPASAHHGSFSVGFHMTPGGQTITAGGAKVEVGVGITNFTGAPYENVSAMLSLYNPVSSHPGEGVDLGTANLRTEDFTVEVMSGGVWKPVALRHSCDPALFTLVSPATTTARLEDGRAANFAFRVGLSAKAPKSLSEIEIGVLATAPGFGAAGGGQQHTYRVERAASEPTTPAKPKPTKPAAPTKKAEPAAAPAADKTPAKATQPAKAPAAAPAAPVATPSAAPATTAPAGTPELAQTGASSANTFLALSSAALLALGAGVLIAVRRLRPQR
ncbi:hypothetical protein GCM10018790_03450 [Kitasatospora xanthocidica]|uniref:LPXTG cell wall anchor domain-containing protein n=1 Tax=Kitasatospora xanthocidica TaxID=83382 RepID=UPI0016728722|nr:LPXTG cell wall anchor domain-containing protein [Kitasatospora xanthocidica]GHF29312.1 hypothetical protein GCM10018790_03450 [Kitasatospora xanthocidica]